MWILNTGSPAVPDMQIEPRFDDGRTIWKWKIYRLAGSPEGFGEVSVDTNLLCMT